VLCWFGSFGTERNEDAKMQGFLPKWADMIYVTYAEFLPSSWANIGMLTKSTYKAARAGKSVTGKQAWDRFKNAKAVLMNELNPLFLK
jgi:hypothetical protein